MPTSVTIDNKLRKRLKRLAAMKDTTQASIIKEAIDLLEESYINNKLMEDNEAKSIIRQQIENVVLEDWELEIREKLSKNGIDIDDLRMEFYEFE